MRGVERYGIGMRRQILCIEVNHIGQHHVAAFLGMEGQHLRYVPGLAEGVEQVFRIVAVIEPLARRGLDQLIDRIHERLRAGGVVIHPVHPHGEVARQVERFGHQGHHVEEPGLLVMSERGGDLHVVFHEDHRVRALGKVLGPLPHELVQCLVAHAPARFSFGATSVKSPSIARCAALC